MCVCASVCLCVCVYLCECEWVSVSEENKQYERWSLFALLLRQVLEKEIWIYRFCVFVMWGAVFMTHNDLICIRAWRATTHTHCTVKIEDESCIVALPKSDGVMSRSISFLDKPWSVIHSVSYAFSRLESAGKKNQTTAATKLFYLIHLFCDFSLYFIPLWVFLCLWKKNNSWWEL